MFKPTHITSNCIFKRKPYLYTKQNLLDINFLNKQEPCTCFQPHYVFSEPSYQNIDLDFEDFKQMAIDSGEFVFDHQTDYTYNLHHPGDKAFRDPYIKEALKEFDLPRYYELSDRNKTPRPGRMYAALLQYTFPMMKRPSTKEHYFWNCLNQSINHVFKNFDISKPCSAESIMYSMPKNTSTGWLALKHYKKAVKKEDMMPIIRSEYYNQYNRISNKLPTNDYTMLAMRGHLSERTKTKTRAIWLVSATTIISELKYFTPFYKQFAEKDFFAKKVLHGKRSMLRLRKFMMKSEDYRLINTDISGWDSFRARWFHEMIMKKIGKYIDFDTHSQRLEYQFCINQALNSKILFPDGSVFRKRCGFISGTAGTLLINTLLNMILSYTVLKMMNLIDFDYGMNKIEDENWLGDDFAFYINKFFTFDLDRYKALVFKYFNLVVKPEKVVIADEINDRKYLGYQLKGGLLFREEKDLFSSVLFCERYFKIGEDFLAISFSRFFSYLLIGGINNYSFLNFFYYYMGKYKERLKKIKYIYNPGTDNIFKLIKDVWNINIPVFNIDTFRNMNLELLKYVLLYEADLTIEVLT